MPAKPYTLLGCPPPLFWLGYLATRLLPGHIYNLLQQRNGKAKKEAENLALKLPLRLENGCLALMATSAPAGGNKERTWSITRTTTAAEAASAAGWPCALWCVCLWPRWMAKYLVGGQVSCSSSSCQQKEGRERERGQRWNEAAGSCQVETCATLQNYQCGNQFHQFSLFPIGRNRNIFVIRLELKFVA